MKGIQNGVENVGLQFAIISLAQKNIAHNVLGTFRKNVKPIMCIDCGKEFEVAAKNNNTFCCDKCYTIYRRKYKAEKERERKRP